MALNTSPALLSQNIAQYVQKSAERNSNESKRRKQGKGQTGMYWTVRKKWPTDIEQQEGRILRQGNLNPKVKIFRYVTEGTFDSYSWVRHEVA